VVCTTQSLHFPRQIYDVCYRYHRRHWRQW